MLFVPGPQVDLDYHRSLKLQLLYFELNEAEIMQKCYIILLNQQQLNQDSTGPH